MKGKEREALFVSLLPAINTFAITVVVVINKFRMTSAPSVVMPDLLDSGVHRNMETIARHANRFYE